MKGTCMHGWKPILVAGLLAVASIGSARADGADDPGRCIGAAATYHQVNADILRAVLRVESAMRPATVAHNSNGSVDVGMAGTNSIHFAELKRHGIQPANLLDACVSTYVAAWQLRRHMVKHGYTWEAVAKYHSGTPYFNWRYQVMLYNELVRLGVLTGPIRAVPPVR